MIYILMSKLLQKFIQSYWHSINGHSRVTEAFVTKSQIIASINIGKVWMNSLNAPNTILY